MNALVVAPIVIPLAAAAVGVAGWRSERLQRVLGIVGPAVGLAAAIALAVAVARHGVIAVQAGGWQAPFGISLVADPLASLMVVLTWLVGLSAAVYALDEISSDRILAGFYPLLHVLLAGVSLSFLTGDLFNLYVGFEVMLMASFVLLAGGGGRSELEGGLKYVTLNLVSSALFLAAVGLLYGITHTLNLADLGERVAVIQAQQPALIAAVGALLLVAFGIKAAVFPLYAWLPASYHSPPVAVSAVFAGLLTKVGVYALIRVLTLVFPGLDGAYRILVPVAALTMVAGVLGAVAQFHVRKVLSWHIVSQIGYMVLGLALVGTGSPATARLALAAAIFYLAHHILVKTNLFLIAGVIRVRTGSEELKGIGGLARSAPWLAALFLVPAASLAGIPPLSGFWAKLAVLRAGIEAGEWPAVAAALAAGLLTLMSMVKIWHEAFWKPAPAGSTLARRQPGPVLRMAPIVVLAALTVAIGLAPQPLFDLAGRAADALLDPGAYRLAVGLARGGGPS